MLHKLNELNLQVQSFDEKLVLIMDMIFSTSANIYFQLFKFMIKPILDVNS